MERKYIIHIFGGVFFAVLFVLMLVCIGTKMLPLSGVIVLMVIMAAAAAGCFLYLIKKMGEYFPVPRQVQAGERPDYRDQNPAKQYRLICQEYGKMDEEICVMRRERLMDRLLRDFSHSSILENEDQQITGIFHSYVFGFEWASYCLIVVQPDDYSSYMLQNNIEQFLLDDFHHVQQVVKEEISAVLNRENLSYGIEFEQSCVFLVNLSGSKPDSPISALTGTIDGLQRSCEEKAQWLEESLHVTLQISISPVFKNPTDMRENYEWTMAMREYSDFVRGPVRVLGPKDFNHLETAIPSENALMEKNYYSALLAEDFEKAEQMLIDIEHSMLSGMHADNNYSVASLKNAVFAYLSAAEKFAMSNTTLPDFVYMPDWRTMVQSAASMHEMEEGIRSFFRFLQEKNANRRTECCKSVEGAAEYLDANYTNSELSVSLIADEMGLSSSYLTRIFKRELGMSIPDYIHDKRVSKARELLLHTNLSVNDIALKVGYTNAGTLNRIFKRNLSVTPGTYRQIARSNEEVFRCEA